MPVRILSAAVAALLLLPVSAFAQSATVQINRISDAGVGDKIGTINVVETRQGMSFRVGVTGLPAGEYGFHIHERGNCGPSLKDSKMSAGEAAGPHYDPDIARSHKGPGKGGHKGDLPVLKLDEQGTAVTVNVEKLRLSDIGGRAIIIREGGDNYTDKPENGGSGARIACGVIPQLR
jgi:Cu-Zn family superoxide dismutase